MDFPFVTAAERAHALCVALQPFVRDLHGDPPRFIWWNRRLPEQERGCSSRFWCAPTIGTVPVATAIESRAEWGKAITSTLLAAPPIVVMGDLGERLNSSALATALTAEVSTDRRLGYSEQVVIPNRATWIITANNAQFSGEDGAALRSYPH